MTAHEAFEVLVIRRGASFEEIKPPAMSAQTGAAPI